MARVSRKSNGAFLSKLAMGLVFAIVFVYSVYHISLLFFSKDVATIVSGVTTHSETVTGRGYIFREEALLRCDYDGAVDYIARDGSKVSSGEKLADIYEVSTPYIRQQVRELDLYIELLERSEIGAEPLDLVTLRADANASYYRLMQLLSSGESGELSAQIQSMMVILNKITLLGNNASQISETLRLVKDARTTLFEGSYITEKSATGGYFYHEPDGYENVFSLSALQALDETSYYEAVNTYKEQDQKIAPSVYGKLAADSSWYFVVSLSNKEAQSLWDNAKVVEQDEAEDVVDETEDDVIEAVPQSLVTDGSDITEAEGEQYAFGQEYTLRFSENNDTSFRMRLDRLIEAPEHGETICVFYCNRLPDTFEMWRAQDVEISISEVSGIYVPRSALAVQDGLTGVYVLRGSVVYFRKIDIVYEELQFCLASTEISEEKGFYSLENNELIITEGENMFHGRILDK